jgi:hypothetical protein
MDRYSYHLYIVAVKIAFVCFIIYNEASPWWLLLLLIL